MPPTTSTSGVHQVPGTDRREYSGDTRDLNSLGDGQLRDTQNTKGQTLVRSTSALSSSFHSDQLVMAEPGGTLLRRNHRETNSTRSVPKRPGPSHGDRRIPRTPQPETAAFRLDGRRRFDPLPGPKDL